MALARALTGTLTRRLETGDSSAKGADAMLKNVIPFLLSPSGIESSAEEVRLFALSTLLQIIKSGSGRVLRPYVPEIVGRLIELLASLEPQQVEYLRLNIDQYGMTAQELDDVRLTAVKASPVMEAIERCLDFLDEPTMRELQSSLENAIKAAVALPSKVGAARILVTLATRHNFIFKQHAAQFLRVACKQVLDRNETVSSSYATACGYLARLASNQEILKLVAFARKLYFDSEDERHRVIGGDIILATSKHATDRFNALAGDILPFVFVAKHDPYDRSKILFQETWNDNVGGSRAVLLYLKEIISLASQYLDSPRWSLKHTSAFAVADVITSSGSEISDPHARIIWPTLEKALAGKAWDGKATVLKSFIKFAEYSTLLAIDEAVASQMQKVVLREAKRNNPQYRPNALSCLADFVELRDTVDLFPQVLEIAKPVIQATLGDASDMDIDEPSAGGQSSKSMMEETLANAVAAVLKSICPKSTTDLVANLVQAVEIVEKVLVESGSRVVHNAIFDAEKSLFTKLHTLDRLGATEDVLIGYVESLFRSLAKGVEQTRIKAAEAAEVMVPLCKGRSGPLRHVLVEGVKEALKQERSEAAKAALRKVGRGLDEV